jgi:hypothetical protein
MTGTSALTSPTPACQPQEQLLAQNHLLMRALSNFAPPATAAASASDHTSLPLSPAPLHPSSPMFRFSALPAGPLASPGGPSPAGRLAPSHALHDPALPAASPRDHHAERAAGSPSASHAGGGAVAGATSATGGAAAVGGVVAQQVLDAMRRQEGALAELLGQMREQRAALSQLLVSGPQQASYTD